jgi:sulfate transport system ATP-binding protein
VALLGPSGCGKTTLLRIIAGLETIDSGSILFDDRDTTVSHVRERKVGFVFQHYALFRHMTAFENVAFGLQVKPKNERPVKSEIKERVMELLRLVQLEAQANQYPWQLSGGQRQRIALARALAVEPQVLLLDEPFGALDAQVRVELRRWLRRLHDEMHITSVFVTHDQEEALEVSDRIVLMNKGKIEQIGTPDEVYENPATPFVMNFLGSVNIFHGRSHHDQPHHVGAWVPEAVDNDSHSVGYVRSRDLQLSRIQQDNYAIKALIHLIHKLGPVVLLTLLLESMEPVEAEMSKEQYLDQDWQTDEQVFVRARQIRHFSGNFTH